eukprot:366301-Chlamydomonas_euryale.AAC.53
MKSSAAERLRLRNLFKQAVFLVCLMETLQRDGPHQALDFSRQELQRTEVRCALVGRLGPLGAGMKSITKVRCAAWWGCPGRGADMHRASPHPSFPMPDLLNRQLMRWKVHPSVYVLRCPDAPRCPRVAPKLCPQMARPPILTSGAA